MLTQIQKESLYNLMVNCLFPELKKVMEKVIPKWISGEIRPKKLDMGITVKDEKFVPDEQKACCFVGAALINERAKYESGYPWQIFCTIFNIKESITAKLMGSFDTGRDYGFPESKYVVEIHKILFN